jgi:hypothetical protein
MKSVHVLHRVDRADHVRLLDLRRKRKLDEDAAHAPVRVQLGDEREELLLGRLRGQLVVEGLDARLAAGLLFLPHVDRRSGVVADEHGGEADRLAELRHLAFDLRPQPLGEGLSVHQGRCHP